MKRAGWTEGICEANGIDAADFVSIIDERGVWRFF